MRVKQIITSPSTILNRLMVRMRTREPYSSAKTSGKPSCRRHTKKRLTNWWRQGRLSQLSETQRKKFSSIDASKQLVMRFATCSAWHTVRTSNAWWTVLIWSLRLTKSHLPFARFACESWRSTARLAHQEFKRDTRTWSQRLRAIIIESLPGS